MNIHIIRVDGTEEFVAGRLSDVAALIGADCLDGFSLRDGRYVYVDDNGHADNRPVNPKATALFCKPGTTWQIRGDVAIVSG